MTYMNLALYLWGISHSSRPIIKTSVNISIVRITFLSRSYSYYQRSLLTL